MIDPMLENNLYWFVNLCNNGNQNPKEISNWPDKKNITSVSKIGVQLMLKKLNKSTSNISEGVAFLLRGAKKRRSMAIASAKMINSDIGISAKLAAVK